MHKEQEMMAKAVKIDAGKVKAKLAELVALRKKGVERMKEIMEEMESQKNVKKAVLDKQSEWWGKAAPERKQQWIQQRAGKLVAAHRRKMMPSFERATALIPNIVAETVLGRNGLNPTDHQEFISSFSKKVKGLYKDNPNARRILSGAGGRDYAYKLAEKMLSVKKSLNEGQRALTPTKEREKPLAKSVIYKQLGFVAEKLEKSDKMKMFWSDSPAAKLALEEDVARKQASPKHKQSWQQKTKTGKIATHHRKKMTKPVASTDSEGHLTWHKPEGSYTERGGVKYKAGSVL